MITASSLICSGAASGSGSGGSSSGVVKSGLLAEYRILPTESAGALVDYSGNGNNATGTVGTAPTIAAVTGGLVLAGNGAVILPAALNSAVTVQVFFNTQTLAGAGGAGSTIVSCGYNGSGTQAVALILLAQGNKNGALTYRSDSISGNVYESIQESCVWGTGSLGMVMDTTANYNRIYQNGVEYTQNYYQKGVSSTITGAVHPFQLGGFSGNYFTGTIYYALFYNRALTAAEMAQNHIAMMNAMANRGVSGLLQANDGTNQAFYQGDSIMAGENGGNIPATVVLNGTWTVANNATVGFTANQEDASAPAWLPILRINAARNFVVQEAGTNDIGAGSSAAATLTYLVDTGRQVKEASPNTKYFVLTACDRNSSATPATIAAFNTLLRQNWRQSGVIDCLIDQASDPIVGAEFASTSGNFTGSLHPQLWVYDNNIVPIYQRNINRIFGNLDFTIATTYTTADPSASTVTAASCTGNIATFTSTMNPAVGSQVKIASIATAGYNSPYPGYTVLTSSGSQFTCANPNSSLATDSGGGTAFIASQKDADACFIVNFGAGNFTLESALGYTGQQVKIKNINGTATTIVPWMLETINGSSSYSLAAQASITLQSVYSAYQATLSAAGNASAGNTSYTGTFSAAFQAAVIAGMFVSINGFVTNASNNGVFVVVSCNSTTLVVANASGVSESHAATVYNTQSNWITV